MHSVGSTEVFLVFNPFLSPQYLLTPNLSSTLLSILLPKNKPDFVPPFHCLQDEFKLLSTANKNFGRLDPSSSLGFFPTIPRLKYSVPATCNCFEPLGTHHVVLCLLCLHNDPEYPHLTIAPAPNLPPSEPLNSRFSKT